MESGLFFATIRSPLHSSAFDATSVPREMRNGAQQLNLCLKAVAQLCFTSSSPSNGYKILAKDFKIFLSAILPERLVPVVILQQATGCFGWT